MGLFATLLTDEPQTAPPKSGVGQLLAPPGGATLLGMAASGAPPEPETNGMFSHLLTEEPAGFIEEITARPEEKFAFSPIGPLRIGAVIQASKRLQKPARGFIPDQRGLSAADIGFVSAERQRAIARKQRETDIKLVEDFTIEMERTRRRGTTTGGQAGAILSKMPGFMLEFIVTGGLNTFGRKGVKKLGVRLLKEHAKTAAGKAAIGAGGFAVGTVFQGTAMPTRAAEAVLRRQTPRDIRIDDDGNVTITGPVEKPFTSLWKGLADHYIEIASEHAGEALQPGIGLIAQRLPFAGKLDDAMRAAWLKKFPKKTGADYAEKLAQKAGYHGIISEVGEEFLGDATRAIVNVNDFGAGPDAKIHERIGAAAAQDVKSLPAMVPAFAVPGAIKAGISAVPGRALPPAAEPEAAPEGPPPTPGELRSALQAQFREDRPRAEAAEAAEQDQAERDFEEMAQNLDAINADIRIDLAAEPTAQEPRTAPETTQRPAARETTEPAAEAAAVTPQEEPAVTPEGGVKKAIPIELSAEIRERLTKPLPGVEGFSDGQQWMVQALSQLGFKVETVGEKDLQTNAPFQVTQGLGVVADAIDEGRTSDAIIALSQMLPAETAPPRRASPAGKPVKVEQVPPEQANVFRSESGEVVVEDPSIPLGEPAPTVQREGKVFSRATGDELTLAPELTRRKDETPEQYRKRVRERPGVRPGLFGQDVISPISGEQAVFLDKEDFKTLQEQDRINAAADIPGQQVLPAAAGEPGTRGISEEAKTETQKLIEAEAEEEFQASQADPQAEQTEEELTGLSKGRRTRLKGQTVKNILDSDIYQAALAAGQATDQEVSVGFYFVAESGRHEIEQVIGEVRKGRFKTALQRQFTFDESDLISKGGSAVSWDVAVQQGFGRGREGVEQTEGHLDLTEFAERVKQALEGQIAEKGTRRLNTRAMDTAAESGEPFIEMMVNKFRMLHSGATKGEINDMIRNVADHYNIGREAILEDTIDGDQIARLEELPDEQADTEIERLAAQEVEAEDRADAEGAARDVLESNGIEVHIEKVEQITPENIQENLPEKPDDDVPFEMREKPTGATLTNSDKQVILLAYGADSVTGYHEGYHVIRPRLTDQDKRILEKAFENEEAEASAFGQYAQDRKTQKGAVKFVFEKLIRLLKKIRSALEGRGFRTHQDIFEQITTGGIRKVSPFLGNARASFEIKEPSQVFYSKLERAVQSKMPNKMDAGAFRNWLNKQGIKPDETKWTGIDDLIAQGKPITKQEALETIRVNDVRIEEVVLGGPGVAKVRDLHQIQTDIHNLEPKQDAEWAQLVNALEALPPRELATRQAQLNIFSFDARFVAEAAVGRQGTTAVDSQKARTDLAQILPEYDFQQAQDLATEFHELENERSEEMQASEERPQFEQYTLPGGRNYREVLLTLPSKVLPEKRRQEVTSRIADIEDEKKELGRDSGRFAALDVEQKTLFAELEVETFQSPHFPETNILTHIRLTDRTNKEGQKVLFIEEIQSDWMQAGRKRGFAVEAGRGREIEKRLEAILLEKAKGTLPKATIEQLDEEGRRLTDELQPGGVPDAPFKKTWHELAFKRVLRMAAEEGYDVVAWTTGEQQADRFDLSKQVDEITWNPNTKSLIAYRNTQAVINQKVESDKLDDVVGKDAAAKLRSEEFIGGGRLAETRSLTGVDLKVGGEGMKAFYDRFIPQFARKYLKKWGAKVGTTRLQEGVVSDVRVKQADNGQWAIETLERDIWNIRETHAQQAIAESRAPIYEESIPEVHSVDVTPRMVESVLAGQVKFETSGERAKREVGKRARIKAKAARMKAARKAPKVSKTRLKFQTKVETEFLREDLKPAELPEGKVIFPERAEDAPLPKRFSEEGMIAHRDAMKRTIRDRLDARGQSLALGLQRALITMSSRLEEIDPLLASKVRRYEFDVMTNIVKLLEATSPFVASIRKIKGDDKADLKYALENNWRDKTDELIDKYGAKMGFENLRAEYNVVREVLDELHAEGNEVGLQILFRADHYPRRVKHLEELLAYLRTTDRWSAFETALQKRKDQAGGRDLTDQEKTTVINTLLRGFRIGGVSLSRPGVVKDRSIQEFDAQIARFYFGLDEALEKYIEDMVQSIGARRFFGRQTAEITKLRGQESRLRTRLHKTQTRVGLTRPITEEKHKLHISEARQKLEEIHEELETLKSQTIETSIGKFTLDLQMRGKLDPVEEKRVAEMLRAIMEPKGMGPNVSFAAKLTYLTLLSNIPVAMTQLQEIAFSFHVDGIRALPAALQVLTNKSRLTPREIGFTDIDQFTKDLGLNEVVSTAIIAMRTTDQFGKRLLLTTLLNKSIRLAKNNPNNAAFMSGMRRVFGAEAREVIDDLANERITTNVKFLMFSKILDVQPLALSETPEWFAIGGNGRIAYLLRLFQIRRFNLMRDNLRKVMKENFRKDPEKWLRALGDLAYLTMLLSLFGIGVEFLKGFWLGKDVEIGQSVQDNLLEFVMLSTWNLDQAKRQGPAQAFFEELAPPAKFPDALWHDVRTGKMERSIRSIPYFGEEYYWWFGGGSEKGERNEFIDIYDPFQ